MNAYYPWRMSSRNMSGFYLLEVLITVLVLSIGMLGVAGLQLISKRSNFEAMQFSTATSLAQDILERMRSNPEELEGYTNSGAGLTLTGGSIAAIDCTNDCTSAQMTQYDLYQLEQSLIGVSASRAGNNVAGLAFPTACISGPAGGSGTYEVAIAWRGKTALNDPPANTCGQGSGLYDSDTGTDEYRRVLALDTFIIDPV